MRNVTGREHTGVERWAWFTLAFFIVVVLEGAVVRITSSGAGCGEHWPLCNGEFFPTHPRTATIIEFVHRSLTGLSSTFFAVLVGWVFYATPKRHPARRAAVIAALLLVVEAALGAVLVLRGYVEQNTSVARVVVQAVHFTNTMLLLGATSATARLLSGSRNIPRDVRTLKPLVWSTVALTIVAGATGSIAALADTLFPSPSLAAALRADFAATAPALIRMRWIHPASTVLLTLCAVALFRALARRSRRVQAKLLAVSLVVQIVFGIADVLLLAPGWLQVLHLLGSDVFWVVLVTIATDTLTGHPTSRQDSAASHEAAA